MLHLNREEQVIMPELQRLYSDEELQAAEGRTYKKKEMTSEAMVNMMTTLFPYMDIHDHQFFLKDIHQAAPKKFNKAFSGIINAVDNDNKSILNKEEMESLLQLFSLTKKDIGIL